MKARRENSLMAKVTPTREREAARGDRMGPMLMKARGVR